MKRLSEGVVERLRQLSVTASEDEPALASDDDRFTIDDRFVLEREIGVGGCSTVYAARDASTGEAVAVKLLDRPGDPERLMRFGREAAILAELGHPRIVRYVAHGVASAGTVYLATALLHGETLALRLARGRLAWRAALELCAHVCEPLTLAHERGLVHRDLKPANLFLVDGSVGGVTLLDFGIARLIADAGELTHGGAMVGTPGYMAPEQVDDARSIDARADVFALGCVLFECIAGAPAFYGQDLLDVCSKVLLERPRPLAELAPEVPPAVADLVECMLEKDRDRRPKDAAEVAQRALNVLVGRAASLPPSPRMDLPAPGAPRSPALFFGRDDALSRYADEMPRVRLSVVYGVGGVGKTAFVLRGSEDLAERLGARRAYVRCRPGESAATLAATAAEQIAPTVNRPPVEALVAAGPVVLVIDDAHLADPVGVAELAEYLVSRSRAMHVSIASRSTLPLSPVAIDHLVIKLSGLDGTAVRELWTALESLYGERMAGARDDRAPLASGNPLLIKRAFAEVSTGEDLLGLGELPELERELLVDLCALRRPVPRDALGTGRGATAVGPSLDALGHRFLVERTRDRDKDDHFGVHDLIREAVYESPWRPTAEVHARWIDHYRATAATDLGAGIELLHHCVAATRDDLVVELLRAEAEQIRRVPPSNALLDRELREAIAELERRAVLPTELRLLRARIRARQGEIRAAYGELEALVGTDSTLECDRAEVAHMLGLTERTRASARAVLSDASASPLLHARALALAVEAERSAGNASGALALTELDTEPLSLLGPLLEGIRAWIRAVTLFDCERYAEAGVEMKRARPILSSTLPPDATPMLGSVERAIHVLLGVSPRGEDDAGELFDENAYFRCVARLLRAQQYVARGRPRRGAELAEQTWAAGEEIESLPVVSWAGWVWAEAACALGEFDEVTVRVPPLLNRLEEAGGHVPPRIRLTLSLGEALLATGDEARALDLARDVHARARDHERSRARAEILAFSSGHVSAELSSIAMLGLTGYGAAEASLARAALAIDRGELDVTAALASEVESAADAAGWTQLGCGAGLLLAECALRGGDRAAARRALDRRSADVVERRYGMLRVHLAALRAAIARAEGRVPDDDDPLGVRALAEVGLDSAWAKRAFARASARLRLRTT